jgi:uncharacterized protein (TIGR00297 family)
MNVRAHFLSAWQSGFSHHLWLGLLLTLAFAALARLLRGVTNGGALAGVTVCFLLYLGGGLGAFAALIIVFLLAWSSTRLGYQRKTNLGIAEEKYGRNACQVLANLGVAAVCAALYRLYGTEVLLLASAAAMSEAAGDTFSSEIGKLLSLSPRLITTWRPVPAGTDGAVSALGTTAGLLAACLVSLVCVVTNFLPARWMVVSVAAAFCGMIVDSFLGAKLQHHSAGDRKILNNDAVNFFSSLSAALIAVLLGLLI